MSAGKKAAHRAQTGRSMSGTNHGLPLVVANVGGIASAGSVAAAPCESLAQRAISAPASTPNVGPKFATFLRILLLKYALLRNARKMLAVKYVDRATMTVSRPLVKEDAGLVKLRPMFCTASTTKMKEMSVEKISSVNLVRYLTEWDAEVTELQIYINEI